MVLLRYLCTLPRVMVIFSILPYSASMSARNLEKRQGRHVMYSDHWYAIVQCIVSCQWSCSWNTSRIYFSDIPFILSFLKVLPKRLVMPLVLYRYPSWLLHKCTSFQVYICRWNIYNIPDQSLKVGWSYPLPVWFVYLPCHSWFAGRLLGCRRLLNPGLPFS